MQCAPPPPSSSISIWEFWIFICYHHGCFGPDNPYSILSSIRPLRVLTFWELLRRFEESINRQIHRPLNRRTNLKRHLVSERTNFKHHLVFELSHLSQHHKMLSQNVVTKCCHKMLSQNVVTKCCHKMLSQNVVTNLVMTNQSHIVTKSLWSKAKTKTDQKVLGNGNRGHANVI